MNFSKCELVFVVHFTISKHIHKTSYPQHGFSKQNNTLFIINYSIFSCFMFYWRGCVNNEIYLEQTLYGWLFSKIQQHVRNDIEVYLNMKYPALLLATFLSSQSFVNFGVIYSETVIKLDQKIKGLRKVYPWVYFYILLNNIRNPRFYLNLELQNLFCANGCKDIVWFSKGPILASAV